MKPIQVIVLKLIVLIGDADRCELVIQRKN